ncbi:MAG TPA: hypothetical protein VNG70_09570 [Candidatus Limnocylindria bacterium]|nr:hypothetical protein [Candidatus Limnocylindria bacterium]
MVGGSNPPSPTFNQGSLNLRGNGITYDTGFFNAGVSTHEPFEPDLVKREMHIIHDDLHCNAVRVTGGNADRLEIAATHAAGAGLEVWFCPFTCDLTTDDMLMVIDDCAQRAQRLGGHGAEIVLLMGSELGLVNKGFLPGDTLSERLGLLTSPDRLREHLGKVPGLINDFLGRAVTTARAHFGGKISYASLPFERVDWAPFDYISTDAAYRSIELADRYRSDIRNFVGQGKPAAITEFGCCTYRGAADRGGHGDSIVEWEGTAPVRLKGEYVRDEDEQARYLTELLDVFNREGVDTAFVNTFACYHFPHRTDPLKDLDLASYGVVKALEDRFGSAYPDMHWEPKVAFAALADYYGR